MCDVNNQVQIEVELFARAFEISGARQWKTQLPCGSTIADLREKLRTDFQQLAPLERLSRWAVGTEFVTDSFVLNGDMCVAMIPPVSGG